MNAESDRRLSALYRATANEEPPAALDHVILAAAERKGAPVATARTPRWRISFALAAVLVLAVSLVIVMHDEPGPDPGETRIERRQSSVPPPTLEKRAEQVADAAKQAAETDAGKPASAAQPSRTVTVDERPRQIEKALSTDARLKEASPSGARDEASGGVGPSSESRPKLAADAPAARAEAAVPATQQPSAAAPSAPAPSESARTAAAQQTDQERSNRVSSEQAAKPALGAAAKRVQAADSRSEEQLTPEQWIERIERLRKDGKEREADASLQAFRKRYPNFPLPDSLR